MKKITMVFFLLLILLLSSACGINESSSENRLFSPSNETAPIQGKWILEEYEYKGSEDKLDIEESYGGEEGLFHRDGIILAGDYSTKPSFKLKNVNASDYLFYKYKHTPEELNIDNEKIQVITVYNDNQFFNEFIKYDHKSYLVSLDNRFYIMRQESKEVSIDEVTRYIEIEKAIIRDADTTETEKIETGILLGLKIPMYDNENNLPNWEYETVWIKSKDKNIYDAYKMKDILLPRKNGFWELSVKREREGEILKDRISLKSRSNPKKFESIIGNRIRSAKDGDLPLLLRNILFIGNNFISLENIDSANDKKTLSIYSIDNIKEEKPVKLSDLIGEEGKTIFSEGVQNIISLEEAGTINESSIGLIRKNGHWIFNGRVNYKQNENELFKEFNIRAIPPNEIVNYDENVIPWEALKRKIPDAIDMYSSPNEEFILAVTNYNIQIYGIENKEKISQYPIKIISLPRNASVIMAEWATGRYVELWEKEVLDNNSEIIKEQN